MSLFHEERNGDSTDEYATPRTFLEPLIEAVGGFDLDPAASSTSDLAERNVTKEEDGLSIPWRGDVWLNPPYSEVADWLEYARRQYEHGNADRIVSLVFARTGTRWWHDNATTADLRCFVKGRLTFGGADNSAPAPSAVLVWGDVPSALEEYLRRKGEVVGGAIARPPVLSEQSSSVAVEATAGSGSRLWSVRFAERTSAGASSLTTC